MIGTDKFINLLLLYKIPEFIFACNLTFLILNICLFNFVIASENKENTKNVKKENSTKIIEHKFLNLFYLITLFFSYSLLVGFLLQKIGNNANLLCIPVFIFVIYVVIIEPFIKYKDNFYTNDYVHYGALIMIFLGLFTYLDYNSIFINIESKTVLEITTILLIIIKIYLSIYSIVNFYFFLKILIKLGFENILVRTQDYILKYFSKYKNIEVSSKNINKYLSNNKRTTFLKITIYFILDIMEGILYYLLFMLIVIFSPLYVLFKTIIKIMKKVKITNENKIIYITTKIALIISLIGTYCIIQKTLLFQNWLISIFEFLATAIIIPILFESLLYFKKI